MRPWLVLLAAAWLGSAVAAAEPVAAAALARDPTVPPLAARAPAQAAAPAPAGAAAMSPGSEPGAPPRHLMVLNGKPYVIERGWPRGVGDRLGEARIERIEGGNVWLRDASGTRKWSLYTGVEIRPAAVATQATNKHPAAPAAPRPRRPVNPSTLATKEPLP